MAETKEDAASGEDSAPLYVKAEENPCPQCGGAMVWVSGGPRCANCGFKESCCF